MHNAVKAGVNFFDTSPYYGRGRSETVLGKALHGLPRDSFVVSSKVGRYDTDKFDFSAERVTKSVDESLARLGLEYLDVVQCHDVEFGDLHQVATETIPALLRLKETGKVRAIGVTGYPVEIFPYLVAATPPNSVDVILSYCNYCLQNDRLQAILEAMRRENVGVINASALSMGLLTKRGPPDWHPAPPSLREKARQASDFCEERGTPLASVALRWALDADPGQIVSTLVGIKDTETLSMNLDIMKQAVDNEMIAGVKGIFGDALNQRWNSGKYLA